MKLLSGATCLFALLSCDAFRSDEPSRMRVIIPTDERSVRRASSPPPPISGGTLLVTRDGLTAVMSEPGTDRIVTVDVRERRVRDSLLLEPGDEPGRLVEDATGRIHIALRRGGAIASIDITDMEVIERRDVCSAPRGIAFDETEGVLYVACVSGKFVSLPVEGTEGLRSTQLPNDLRDVVITSKGIWVSRFRSAEVLRVTPEGQLIETLRPLPRTLTAVAEEGENAPAQTSFLPTVAWRLRATKDGAVAMVHQRVSTEDIQLDLEPDQSFSPYGGNSSFFGCHGIVRSSITVFDVQGPLGGFDFPGTLPVDLAVNPTKAELAVARAGLLDFGAPRQQLVSSDGQRTGELQLGNRGFPGDGGALLFVPDMTISCQSPHLEDEEPPREGFPVAVAITPDDEILLQTRHPSTLQFLARGSTEILRLGESEQADTAFEMFYHDTGAGLACASCHPEGTDDGHVWHFAGLGKRRTLGLDRHLKGTAPFHWDGSLEDIPALVSEVLVHRMGAAHQSDERVAALRDWLFQLEPPASEPALDADQVRRGRDLFRSSEVGCADCHAGDSFTDNESYDVGTHEDGLLLQVPSLIGVSTRGTLMHNGCVSSLEDWFSDPCVGGDSHGQVSDRTRSETEDLIAYLRTL